MGLRGPRPTPKEELKARGSWRAGLAEDTVDYDPTKLRALSWMPLPAKRLFRRLAAELHDKGLTARVDQQALVRYCVLAYEWKKAAEFLEKNGSSHLVKDKDGNVTGVKAYPQVRALTQLSQQMLALEREFGFTPSARARIPAAEQEDDEDRGKGRFFRVAQ